MSHFHLVTLSFGNHVGYRNSKLKTQNSKLGPAPHRCLPAALRWRGLERPRAGAGADRARPHRDGAGAAAGPPRRRRARRCWASLRCAGATARRASPSSRTISATSGYGPGWPKRYSRDSDEDDDTTHRRMYGASSRTAPYGRRSSVVIHAQHIQVAPPAVMAGGRLGVPVVVTVRDHWPWDYFATGLHGDRLPL